MGKRIVAALSLMLISLSFAVFSYFYIRNTGEKIISQTYALTENCLEGESLYESSSELFSLWDRHSRWFAVILKHSDADTVNGYFIRLKDAVRYSDKEEICSVSLELCAFLSIVVKGEAPVIENIF